MPVAFVINNALSLDRAAILSPMAGTMDVTSSAVVGVADQQQVAFTGIESILEKTLSLEDSIKLLSCFSLTEQNTAPAGGNDTTSNLAPVYNVDLSKEEDFKSILKMLFEGAVQVSGESVSNGDTAEFMLSDSVRTYLNSLLANNGLLDLLEASNVMNISVEMKKDEGAKDMYDVIRGFKTSRVSADDARAKRRLFLSQIPLNTLKDYIKEGTTHLDFLPLKGGDSMTFVFDITVTPPTMTTMGKNATGDLNGANVQDGGSNPAVSSPFGKYGMTVVLNSAPVTRRVAFVAHLGNTATEIKSGLFPQDYTATQYTAVELASGVDSTLANYETAFKAVAGRTLATAAPASDPTLQPAFETASKNLYATILANEGSIRDEAASVFAASEKLLSLETAIIDKVKAEAALIDMKAKRSTLSGEITQFTTVFTSAEATYNSDRAAYSAWQDGIPADTNAWAGARIAARNVLDGYFVARTSLSQEVFNAEYAYADSMDMYYPAGATEPKKLATLSSELADAEAAYLSAKAAYESGSVTTTTAFGDALEDVRVAEEALARKVYVMSDAVKATRLAARSTASTNFGSNETAISSGVTNYNNSYTKGWKKDAGVTVRDETKDVAAYVDNTSRGSILLAYADSYQGVEGQKTDGNIEPVNVARTDKEQAEALWFNVNNAIGDTSNPISGQQAAFNEASGKVGLRQEAAAANLLAGSTYTANTGAALTSRGLITSGGVAVTASNGSPNVAAAETAYSSAKIALNKKLAHIKVVGDRLAAYLASSVVSVYRPAQA